MIAHKIYVDRNAGKILAKSTASRIKLFTNCTILSTGKVTNSEIDIIRFQTMENGVEYTYVAACLDCKNGITYGIFS